MEMTNQKKKLQDTKLYKQTTGKNNWKERIANDNVIIENECS